MQILDHGLPVQYLKHLRHELVLRWQKPDAPQPTMSELTELAAIQQSIIATEAVVAEIDAKKAPAPDVKAMLA